MSKENVKVGGMPLRRCGVQSSRYYVHKYKRPWVLLWENLLSMNKLGSQSPSCALECTLHRYFAPSRVELNREREQRNILDLIIRDLRGYARLSIVIVVVT